MSDGATNLDPSRERRTIDPRTLSQVAERATAVIEEVQHVFVGPRQIPELLLVALLAKGHALLEGVPGVAKTTLCKAFAATLGCHFRRIQFTPDLMPADIIGTNIMSTDDQGRYRFEFRKGPIFTQLLLADEINRASPKTQSALLETMQEQSVTTGGTIHHLTPPFFVLATQNPIEQEGTYPLPEAQLDRFLFKVTVPFLNRDELNEVANRTILRSNIELPKLLDGPRIMECRKTLDKVVVTDALRDYACRLVLATHPDSEFATPRIKQFVRWGASPRAAQGLIRAARVRALAEGRAHVAFEDIRHFASEVLQHRVLLNYDGQAENIVVTDLVTECVRGLPEAM